MRYLLPLLAAWLFRKLSAGFPLSLYHPQPWPVSQPLVSVIIPCYNHWEFVDEAVQSILAQTWQNVEIIIVDDASNQPEAAAMFKNYRPPKTRILHQPENQGLSAARNAGMRQSRGKYICCLDADDKLQATYIEKAVTALEVNAGIALFWPWTQVFGAEERVWYAPQFDPEKIIYYNQAHPPAVFRRAAFEKSGGFNEDMREGFEDWEFWVRLTGHGYRGFRISEKLLFYRRLGRSFAQEAAQKHELLFASIQANNPEIYRDPPGFVARVRAGYRDIYSLRPFLNLQDARHFLPLRPTLVISDLDSARTRHFLSRYEAPENLVWVARQPVDEDVLDQLYAASPYIYILPNYLPTYVWTEFIHQVRRRWPIQNILRLTKAQVQS
jgi:glycosyltransferase involved in cell wall biosynthesis